MFFLDKFKDFSNVIVQKEIGESSWFGFSIILDKNSPIQRKELISELQK